MNFKSLALGSVLAVSSIFGFNTLDAKAVECIDGNGYRMCFDLISRNGQYNSWNVGVRNAHTDEYMTVTCNGKYVSDWNSRGGFSQSEAQYLADYFCSL